MLPAPLPSWQVRAVGSPNEVFTVSRPDRIRSSATVAWFSDSSSGKPSGIWARLVVSTRLSSPAEQEAGLAGRRVPEDRDADVAQRPGAGSERFRAFLADRREAPGGTKHHGRQQRPAVAAAGEQAEPPGPEIAMQLRAAWAAVGGPGRDLVAVRGQDASARFTLCQELSAPRSSSTAAVNTATLVAAQIQVTSANSTASTMVVRPAISRQVSGHDRDRQQQDPDEGPARPLPQLPVAGPPLGLDRGQVGTHLPERVERPGQVRPNCPVPTGLALMRSAR